MTLERDIDVLKQIPFFAEFPTEPLKLLAFGSDSHDLPDKTTLFKAGERADGGYVVMNGRVDLVADVVAGRGVVASLPPGTLIGEIALIVETSRPADAVTVGRTRVLYIRRPLLRRILDEYPDTARMVYRQFADRVAGIGPEVGRIADLMGGAEE
jgi:CRP-like cAMP-binding protein